MREQNAYDVCMHGTWNGTRVAAAIIQLKDAGMSEANIALLAGVSRATANRWARGANRPDHDSVQRLAARVWHDHPGTARELVEAAGYPWREPDAASAPPLIAPEVEADIRRLAESDEEADELLAAMRERRLRKLRDTGGHPAA